jgi:uncharacterized protein YndB with AHSA1/START domain
MFTTPEHLAQWLPPVGFRMEFRRVNIATGGENVFAMKHDAFTMFGRIQYVLVERPHRIEYTQRFTDEHEQMARHPGSPNWPETLLTSVQFTEEGPTQTRVTLRSSVFGSAAPHELAAFVEERAGMTKGWTGSFDKLEELISINA